MAKASEKGGFGLGTAIEIVMVIINSTKNKEPGTDGKGGLTLDKNKLAWGLSGIAGQQALKSFSRRRERKQLAQEYEAGLISEADFKAGRRASQVKKKKNRFGTGLLAGLAVGGVTYILAMPPEQRARFFKQIDQIVNQVSGIIGELQGKPYSEDYEPKSNTV